MQFLLEFVIWIVTDVIGGGIKRTLGMRRSSSGISEMWIGVLVCVAVIALLVALIRNLS